MVSRLIFQRRIRKKSIKDGKTYPSNATKLWWAVLNLEQFRTWGRF